MYAKAGSIHNIVCFLLGLQKILVDLLAGLLKIEQKRNTILVYSSEQHTKKDISEYVRGLYRLYIYDKNLHHIFFLKKLDFWLSSSVSSCPPRKK